MIANTVEASHDFRSGLGDAFDSTARTDLPPSVEIFIRTEQVPVGCCYRDVHGAGAIYGITLAQTNEAGSFSAEITVCVGIQYVACCRASVADVTRTQR